MKGESLPVTPSPPLPVSESTSAPPPLCTPVVGDVNSTVACALTAAKLGIRVAHVEAGLRSFDRTMPEEYNRVLTNHIADLLFTTEPSANENLRREGIPEENVHFVGNVMIDTLVRHKEMCFVEAGFVMLAVGKGSCQ